MMTDVIGTIMSIVNTVEHIASKAESAKKAPVEVVDNRPIVVQQPASQAPTQPISVNLTINVYTDSSGVPAISRTKNGLSLELK